MAGVARRLLHPFLLPAGLAAGCAWAVLALGLAASWPRPVLDALPYALAAAGFLAGWRFNRSRVAFATVVVAAAWYALSRHPAGPAGTYVAHAIAILAPVLLAALSLGAERGVLSPRGLVRLAAVAAPVAVAVWIGAAHRADALAVLGAEWLPLPRRNTIGLSPTALAAAGLSLAFLFARSLRRNGALEAGLFWSAAALLAAVAAPAPAPTARAVLTSAAVLALLVGLFESSHALAFRDELTGLPARRALREALLRLGGRWVVAMVDVDHFKKVNDRHGHDVGDDVLRMIAARLAAVGGGGRAFRYGGEEFTLLFAGKDLDEALPHLEALRAAIEASPFALRRPRKDRRRADRGRPGGRAARTLRVTVSVGAAAPSDRAPDPAAALKAADQALYRAKKSGRNRICH